MTQEVQVTISLEVDASKSKEDIKAFILDMVDSYENYGSRNVHIQVTKSEITDIKEESEIYDAENNQSK